MPTRAFKLVFNSPLHVGEAGVGYEETRVYIPSDTLFSALVITWLQMGAAEQRAVAQLKETFAEKAPLLLTSAFPTIGDVRLFPRPHLSIMPTVAANDEQDAKTSPKKFKKVQWVSEEIFTQLVGGVDAVALGELWQHGKLVQGGTVWVSKSEADHIENAGLTNYDGTDRVGWQIDKVPHVTVDRNSSASMLYHVGRVYFQGNSGLWFLATGEEAWLERTENALHLLQDSGIGGQRSRGHGRFVLDDTLKVPSPGQATGEYQILLSRLAPRESEMGLLKANQSRYDLATVGGYSNYPGREAVVRRRVRMVSEGSVIQQSDQPPGQLVNVKPEVIQEPIYRYGFGYGVPITLAEGAST
jgi:CRISPR-associated protein Csm4